MMIINNDSPILRTAAAVLALTLVWPSPAFALKAQAPSENSGLEELAASLRADAGLEEPARNPGGSLGGTQTRREFLKTLSALVQLGTRLGALADALSPPATSPGVPTWEPYRELLRDVASATTINPVADAEWFRESLTQWLVSANDNASEWKLDERTLQQLAATRQLLQRGDEDARAFQEKVATADGRTALIQEVRQLWNPEVPTDWMRAMDAKGAPVGSALRAFFTSAELRNAGRSRELAAMLKALTDEQVADGLAWATAERLRIVQGRIEPWTASFKRLLGSDWADLLRRYESEPSQFVQAPQRAALRSGDAPQETPDRKSTEASPDQRTAPVAQKSPVGPEGSGILGLLLARMPQPDTGELFETWLRRIHAPQGPGLVSPAEETARRLRTLLRNYHFAQQAALWEAFVAALPSVQENPYQVAWLTGTLEHAAALHELQGPPSEAPIQRALTLLRTAPPPATGLEEPTQPAPWDQPMDRRAFLERSGKTLAAFSRISRILGALSGRFLAGIPSSPTPPAWDAYRPALRGVIQGMVYRRGVSAAGLARLAWKFTAGIELWPQPGDSREMIQAIQGRWGAVIRIHDITRRDGIAEARISRKMLAQLEKPGGGIPILRDLKTKTSPQGLRAWIVKGLPIRGTTELETVLELARQPGAKIADKRLAGIVEAVQPRLQGAQHLAMVAQQLPDNELIEGLRWAVGDHLHTAQAEVQQLEHQVAALRELGALVAPAPAMPSPPGPTSPVLLGTREPLHEVLQRLRERGASLTPAQAQVILDAQAAGANEVLLVPLTSPPAEMTVALCASGELYAPLTQQILGWPAWPSAEAPVAFVVQGVPTEGALVSPAVAVRLASQPRVPGLPNLVVTSPDDLVLLTPTLVASVAHPEAALADQDLPVVAALPLTVDGRAVLALFL